MLWVNFFMWSMVLCDGLGTWTWDWCNENKWSDISLPASITILSSSSVFDLGLLPGRMGLHVALCASQLHQSAHLHVFDVVFGDNCHCKFYWAHQLCLLASKNDMHDAMQLFKHPQHWKETCAASLVDSSYLFDTRANWDGQWASITIALGPSCSQQCGTAGLWWVEWFLSKSSWLQRQWWATSVLGYCVHLRQVSAGGKVREHPTAQIRVSNAFSGNIKPFTSWTTHAGPG